MTANYREVEGVQVLQQGDPITLRPIAIFPTGPFNRDEKLCFVIMPFAAQFQAVYDEGIKPGVEIAGLRCLRGDDIMQPGFILGQIWSSLMEARYVVADLTAGRQ